LADTLKVLSVATGVGGVGLQRYHLHVVAVVNRQTHYALILDYPATPRVLGFQLRRPRGGGDRTLPGLQREIRPDVGLDLQLDVDAGFRLESRGFHLDGVNVGDQGWEQEDPVDVGLRGTNDAGSDVS